MLKVKIHLPNLLQEVLTDKNYSYQTNHIVTARNINKPESISFA